MDEVLNDEAENAAWSQEAFESAEDRKARKNLRNVLVQILVPYHGNEPTKLVEAAKVLEAYVLAD